MSLFTRLSELSKDRSGQFAVIFSLMILPVLAGVGIGVDYAYALQTKTRLQDATDAAALFAAREYRKSGELPPEADVFSFVELNYSKVLDENMPVIKAYKLQNDKVVLETNVVAPLTVMGIFGHEGTKLNVDSVVVVGPEIHVEIALALDTTFSMHKPSGSSADQIDPTGAFIPPGVGIISRITALKVASLKFNDAIFGAGSPGSRRIAVVPFSRYVNVGLSQRGQPWLDVPADTASTGTECSDWFYPVVTWSTNCTPMTRMFDGVEINYDSCEPIYGPQKVQICTPTGESRWMGCVGSRNEPYNLKEAFSGRKFPGLMNISCGTELLPLSSDKVKVANTISALSPNEPTYIPEGVMWGIRTLTGTSPFTEASASTSTKTVRKILVLMTDGENQSSARLPDYPTHDGDDFAQADDWTTKACDAAKEEGIEVFSVTFGIDVTATAKSIIKNCASSPSNYYDASNAEKLVNAFQDIAAQINKMYLAG